MDDLRQRGGWDTATLGGQAANVKRLSGVDTNGEDAAGTVE
jgi:hypothetical protein